ncbi:hypothetical protein GCM10020000_59340 [Streptomyces olivoverticillatus]
MNVDTAALLARLASPACPPFALLHRRTPGHAEDIVELLLGPVTEADSLAGIPLPDGPPAPGGPVHDALAVVPFRQIRERGFDVRDDGTPLLVLRPEEAHDLPLAEVMAALLGPRRTGGGRGLRRGRRGVRAHRRARRRGRDRQR